VADCVDGSERTESHAVLRLRDDFGGQGICKRFFDSNHDSGKRENLLPATARSSEPTQEGPPLSRRDRSLQPGSPAAVECGRADKEIFVSEWLSRWK
jgi:hypothetical protein